VYNVEEYLDECINSVLQQSYQEFEIILVDDGSRDSSGEMCDAYKAKDERIKSFHKENGGLSSARNYGIDKAKGDYLYFLDSDDFLRQGALDTFAEYAMKNSFPEIITENGMCTFLDGKVDLGAKYVGGETFGKKSGEDALLFFLNGASHFSACGKCFRRDKWLENGWKFTEGITSEDFDLTYKVVLKAMNVVMTEEPYYVYRVGRAGSITNTASAKKMRDIMDIILRWQKFVEENDCKEEIKEGLLQLWGNVFVYNVLMDLRKLWSDKRLVEEVKRYTWLIDYSDAKRVSKIEKIVSDDFMLRNFKVLWRIDIYFIAICKRIGIKNFNDKTER